MDAYINIRIRFQKAEEANTTPRLPDYPKVNSFTAAANVFFDFWKAMTKMPGFPVFPRIRDVPVSDRTGRQQRKRARINR
jgi:hypothetical protein